MVVGASHSPVGRGDAGGGMNACNVIKLHYIIEASYFRQNCSGRTV
jgi:hypothetical protein